MFNYIKFVRMRDILDFPVPERMTEIIYVANCTAFRLLLLNQYGRDDLNIDHEIATNPDTKLTYLGYKSILESDLNVAKLADGEWISAPMSEFSKDDRLELVYEDDRPSYFKEKLRERDGLGIEEATTGYYIQEASPHRAIEYPSGESTPTLASPNAAFHGHISVFSPRTTGTSIAATKPETAAPLSFALSGLEAVEDKSISVPSSGESPEAAEVQYGKRLIPQIIDSLAASEPERIVFSLATLSGDSVKLQRISAYVFNKAIDKTAWWLSNLVDKPDSVQPVGYIGPRRGLYK
ncbi:hypothetical protein ACHAQJ_001638 [Trichoderma viride]